MTDTSSEWPSIGPGDIVIDADDTSPSPAVVVKTPNAIAADWRVPGGTVADTNPDYPATDPVVVVVFRDDLEDAYPRYTGGLPLSLAQINRDGLRHYSFPKSRLRRIDQLEPTQLTLDAIDPNPYHSRNFTVDENRDYIAAIRDRGRPDPPPIVRDCGDRFELLNGHKRVWASYVAGLESIPCDVHYERELYAARTWARYHLQGYSEPQRQAALRRIESRLDGQQAAYIRREYIDSEETGPETEDAADGKRTEA
ncbi:ParB N-terminal domain-containing protein [Natrinema pallidum]|uniref:ParB-like N-terminal domain-containing protein n=1 Tax=Natrinema pallidum TaxID=69527 RepID=A0A4P9TE65_9EURY|nr:ParB N-terminal domain-containing protein [Natrinema pallidum]QCW02092.1 hypothetical protein FGF80_02045 [Natrinema pallidum]